MVCDSKFPRGGSVDVTLRINIDPVSQHKVTKKCKRKKGFVNFYFPCAAFYFICLPTMYPIKGLTPAALLTYCCYFNFSRKKIHATLLWIFQRIRAKNKDVKHVQIGICVPFRPKTIIAVVGGLYCFLPIMFSTSISKFERFSGVSFKPQRQGASGS